MAFNGKINKLWKTYFPASDGADYQRVNDDVAFLWLEKSLKIVELFLMMRLSKCLIAGTLPRDDHEGYWEEAEQENLHPHRNYERRRRRKLIGGCPRHRKEVALFNDCLSKSWPFTCLLTARPKSSPAQPIVAGGHAAMFHSAIGYLLGSEPGEALGVSLIHSGVQQGRLAQSCLEIRRKDGNTGPTHPQRQESGYPLVNLQKTMERSTMLLMGKNSLFLWPCSIANCWHNQRVQAIDRLTLSSLQKLL
jgi:hypothetical protein